MAVCKTVKVAAMCGWASHLPQERDKLFEVHCHVSRLPPLVHGSEFGIWDSGFGVWGETGGLGAKKKLRGEQQGCWFTRSALSVPMPTRHQELSLPPPPLSRSLPPSLSLSFSLSLSPSSMNREGWPFTRRVAFHTKGGL
jgi:hypothetical protein